MTQIVIDRQLRGRLHELSKHLEFVDESGELLGYFTPAQDHEDVSDNLTDAAVADVQRSQAELLNLAAANPPPSEWLQGEEECPFR